MALVKYNGLMESTIGSPHNAETPDGSITYYSLGEGVPLVLLHGLGGSALVWRRVMPLLAEHFTVYAPDLWRSTWVTKKRSYTTADAVSFVTAFLDAMGCASAHLCGSSLGGLMAGFTALRHPQRVRTLTLAASAGLGRQAVWWLRAMTLPFIGEIVYRPTRNRVRAMVRALVHSHAAIDDALVEALYEERLSPGVTGRMLQVLRSGVTPFGTRRSTLLLDRLREIPHSTLVLWGSHEPLFPLEQAKRAVTVLPHGQLKILEGTGHWPHFERPEAFAETIVSFAAGADLSDELTRTPPDASVYNPHQTHASRS